MKIKEFVDREYEILGVGEGVGNRKGTVGFMSFKTDEGISFNSNVKGNFDYLREVWGNKDSLIGKLATIKYFNLSNDMVPRFPYVINIRDVWN